ncbi:UbiX family flavin prenyltransferase [Haloferax sp. DFSO52]|uniref:UbiX family flavin prenyltransferase n=1 Tax=Haloferax sp. DFSO52 TaxID=3388505 RepID=UPI003A8C77FC
MPNRVVIGMTGATGQIYGIRALELLEPLDCEVHLILSNASKINIKQEARYDVADIEALADVVHSNKNIGATTASGSFNTNGMLIVPCSMKTLSNIAHAASGSLITRSADVMLKERRPLVVMPREKPFNRIHLKNMLEVTDAGGIVFPPFPSFYQQPKTIDEMITRTMARALSHLDVNVEYDEWEGIAPDE